MTVTDILQQAAAFMRQSQVPRAFDAIDRGLAEFPGHADLLRYKAAIAWQISDLYLADDCLREIIARQNGATPETDLMVAQLALDLLEFPRARAAIDRLLASQMPVTQYAPSAVRLLVWQGERDMALSILNRALAQAPQEPHLRALQITHQPDVSAADLNLAEMLADGLAAGDPAKTGLMFPLARYHDRAGDPARAWQLVQQANQLSAAQRGLTCSAETAGRLKRQLVSRAQRALDLARELPTVGPEQDVSYVYLVGAPRTGSSLLQSILAAHEGAHSTGERGALLPYLNPYCDAADSVLHPEILQQIQDADRSGLARAGLSDGVLIDKTTHNLMIAPLIARVHPGARFVNVLRRPQDVALSILFHEFPPAFPESVWLDGIIAMLEARQEVAALYANAGFEMKTVNFNAFTDEPERIGNDLAAFCGLTWQADKLQPDNRESAVPTFSAGQVRQPIKPTPANKWSRFAAHMTPTQKEALAALGLAPSL